MPVKTGETIIKVPAIQVPAEIAAKGLSEAEAEKLCADLWKKAVKPVEDAIKGIIKNLADSKTRKWIDPDWGPGAKPGDKDGAHAFYYEKNPNKVCICKYIYYIDARTDFFHSAMLLLTALSICMFSVYWIYLATKNSERVS